MSARSYSVFVIDVEDRHKPYLLASGMGQRSALLDAQRAFERNDVRAVMCEQSGRIALVTGTHKDLDPKALDFHEPWMALLVQTPQRSGQ